MSSKNIYLATKLKQSKTISQMVGSNSIKSSKSKNNPYLIQILLENRKKKEEGGEGDSLQLMNNPDINFNQNQLESTKKKYYRPTWFMNTDMSMCKITTYSSNVIFSYTT